MASFVPDLHPAVTLKFSNNLPHLHNSQQS